MIGGVVKRDPILEIDRTTQSDWFEKRPRNWPLRRSLQIIMMRISNPNSRDTSASIESRSRGLDDVNTGTCHESYLTVSLPRTLSYSTHCASCTRTFCDHVPAELGLQSNYRVTNAIIMLDRNYRWGRWGSTSSSPTTSSA